MPPPYPAPPPPPGGESIGVPAYCGPIRRIKSLERTIAAREVPPAEVFSIFWDAPVDSASAAVGTRSCTFVIRTSKLFRHTLTRPAANRKGEHRTSRTSCREMSDSQLTSLARLSDRLVTLKER